MRKGKSLRTVFDEEWIAVSEARKRVAAEDEASRGLRGTGLRGMEDGTPLPESPDVRQKKVDRIRRELAEGRYQVSSADLARKLIVHMLRHAG